MPILTTLTTSLSEIRSFNPCASGWKNILQARKPSCDADYDIQFPLVDCLESNTILDVLWLIGKRKKEIQIAVRFARMCADSVKDLDSYWGKRAAYAADAADAAAYAAAYAADAADAADAAADAADAATFADAADADAAYAAADAYEKQETLNKQFLIQCINEFQA